MPQLENEVNEFVRKRREDNDLVLKNANIQVKKFFSLDAQVFGDGELPVKIKELLGLVASMVLRCDDCVTYHLVRCHNEGVTHGELQDALAIGLVVGGSITIPHLRRAAIKWDELSREQRKLTV